MKVNLEVYSQRGLQITDRAVDVLAQEGFDPVYGARPLRRAIQSALQNKVADKLLEDDFDAERIIVVDAEGEKICLTVSGEESPVQEKQEEQLEKA